MMSTSIPDDHPLRHLFGVLAERSFLHYLRWDDLHVTSYISELLMKFIDMDRLYTIRNRNGEQVGTVMEMLYESDVLLNAKSFECEHEIHQHIGDFTLFMSGIFPQYLQRIKSSGMIHHGDFLIDYIKTGMAIVAKTHRTRFKGSPIRTKSLNVYPPGPKTMRLVW